MVDAVEVIDEDEFLQVEYPAPAEFGGESYSICFCKEYVRMGDINWTSVRLRSTESVLMYLSWEHLVEAAHAIIQRDLRLKMERGDG